MAAVGVSAEIWASSIWAGPLKTTVLGGPPMNNAALDSPAGAVTVAENVTLAAFETVSLAGDTSDTAGSGTWVSAATSSKSKLTSLLDADD